MRNYLFLLAILLFISCEEKEQGDKLTQNLTSLKGFVFVSPKNGNSKNIKVQAENNSFNTTVYTDSIGQYRFNKLPFGTYKITFSKDGMGTIYLYSIKINGLDSMYYAKEVSMFKAPGANVELSKVSVQKRNSLRMLQFNINFTDSSYLLGFRFFFSNNKNVSISNYKETIFTYCPLSDKITFSTELPYFFSNLNKSETIYFIGYICNSLDEGYWDYELNRIVYPTLSKTNTGVLSINYNEK